MIIFLLFFSSFLSAYYESKYEGLNPVWAKIDRSVDRLEVVSFFLPENPIVFEVGASDGNESVLMAKIWPQGKIISFEANPNAFAKYQNNTRGLSNTVGYNLAVNTYKGTADFYLCWGYGGNNPIFEGASSLLKASKWKEADYEGPVIQVPCVIFDDWCQENKVDLIDFMWLDLEGFELPFLKSSPNILKTVQVIYSETNFKNFREGMTQFPELHRFLIDQGFSMVAHWYLEGYQGDALFVRNEKL
jgi:FkbM family methyltransferase